MPEMDEPYTHANNQYTAFFAIEDSTFYLTAIYTDKTDSSSSSGLENLIGSIFNTSEKIRMDWFSSTVIFGTSTLGVNKKVYGKQKHEMFLVAAVSEGQVLSVKTLKAKTLKRMRHQCFKEFLGRQNVPNYIKRFFIRPFPTQGNSKHILAIGFLT